MWQDTMLIICTDPGQKNPIDDPEIEAMMIQYLIQLMQANDAPPDQFERLGLLETYQLLLQIKRVCFK
jgi:hypothetical protein